MIKLKKYKLEIVKINIIIKNKKNIDNYYFY